MSSKISVLIPMSVAAIFPIHSAVAVVFISSLFDGITTNVHIIVLLLIDGAVVCAVSLIKAIVASRISVRL